MFALHCIPCIALRASPGQDPQEMPAASPMMCVCPVQQEPSCPVSCAQMELLDTGSAAELVTPLPLGQQPVCKKMVLRWDHRPIHRGTKSSLDL